MGYKFTTGLEFKKRYKLDYEIIIKHEHVNTADEIEFLLKYFYKKISRKLFGINKTFAFYRYYECSEPNIEEAKEYLNKLQNNAKTLPGDNAYALPPLDD